MAIARRRSDSDLRSAYKPVTVSSRHTSATAPSSCDAFARFSRLLLVPIIAVLDAWRARQLTEQSLSAITGRRGKVLVFDLRSVPTIDAFVASHMVEAVEGCRMMGAQVIRTGLSAGAAVGLASLDIDLRGLDTAADLHEVIAMAQRILG